MVIFLQDLAADAAKGRVHTALICPGFTGAFTADISWDFSWDFPGIFLGYFLGFFRRRG